jgi:hypothetical protein
LTSDLEVAFWIKMESSTNKILKDGHSRTGEEPHHNSRLA